MTALADCTHDRLMFQSGGYYIFCGNCWQRWVANKPHGGDSDIGYDGKIVHGDRVPEKPTMAAEIRALLGDPSKGVSAPKK